MFYVKARVTMQLIKLIWLQWVRLILSTRGTWVNISSLIIRGITCYMYAINVKDVYLSMIMTSY